MRSTFVSTSKAVSGSSRSGRMRNVSVGRDVTAMDLDAGKIEMKGK